MKWGPKMWDQVQDKSSGAGWELLPETGWFALLAWAAGPENVGRATQSDASRTVRRTLLQDGVESRSVEPFMDTDRLMVDEVVNTFLLDAGVPARPAGFDWFLRVPEGWPAGLSLVDELASQITGKWESGTHPAALRPLFSRVVGEFYAAAAR